MEDENTLGKSPGRYLMPDMVTALRAILCLLVVLHNSEKAKGIFKEIIQCYRLPDFRESFDKVKINMPDGVKVAQNIGKASGFKHGKGKFKPELKLPDGKALEGVMGYFQSYAYLFDPWVDLKRGRWRSQDFEAWFDKIQELIKVGFNNPDQMVKGRCKVNPGKSLVDAIIICSLAVNYEDKLRRWENMPVVLYGKRMLTVKEIMDYSIPRRFHQLLSKRSREAGYEFHHDDKLVQAAERWYQCRVVYSGPKEFCIRYNQKPEGQTLDPANVSNEIRAFDKAIGYQRIATKPRTLKPRGILANIVDFIFRVLFI